MIKRLGRTLALTDEDKTIIQTDIRISNIKRILYITAGTVCVNIFILFHFVYNVDTVTPVAIKWRRSIVLMHCILLIVDASLLGVAIYVNRAKKFYGVLSGFLIMAVFALLPLWGAAATILDQMVTPSIAAFFINCAACSMALLIRPVLSFSFYILAYIVFYAGIAVTQLDASALLSNRVNGFGSIALCFGLSIWLWRNNMIRYRQARLIKEQHKNIQDNYEQLLVFSDELKAANETKDRFFSIIAHDLRGPVTSTLALAQLINLQSPPDNNDEQHKLMQLLQNSLSNAAKLLENLLVWSKSQTNSIAFNPVFLNVHDLVESNFELLNLAASEKNIVVQCKIDNGLEIYADREMMNTIIRNLLSNALKFTGNNGEIIVTGIIAATEGQPGKTVQVSVQDNGIGMPAPVKDNLFKTGTRVLAEGTKKESGTGLGLILCKEFVQKHGGSIWAENVPTGGSCFTFALPLVANNNINAVSG